MEQGNLSSKDAHELLARWPNATSVLDQVFAYFGDSFVIVRQDPRKEHSSLEPIPDPDGSFNLLCWLRTNELAAPSLLHELLHAKLIAEGFPLMSNLKPVTSDQASQNLWPLNIFHGWLANAIQHEIFVSDFLSAGFPSDHFFYGKECLIDPFKARKQSETEFMEDGIAPLRRGLWGTMYLCQRLEKLRGFASEADKLLEFGKSMFPETMAADDAWISAWIKSGDFRDANLYAKAFVAVMNRFELPAPSFYRVNRSTTGIVWASITVGAQ